MPSIQEAIELLKQATIAEPSVFRAPTTEELAHAESYLGAPLPPTFKVFLASAGSYKLPYWETFWVGDDSLGYRNIIEANRSEREDAEPALPPFLITFHNNGMGDQLCFDTRFRALNGEYPIVFWDHELPADQDPNVVADSFAHWLYHEAQTSLKQSRLSSKPLWLRFLRWTFRMFLSGIVFGIHFGRSASGFATPSTPNPNPATIMHFTPSFSTSRLPSSNP